MPHTLAGQLSALATLAAALYALSAGERPERIGGATVLLSMIAAVAVQDRVSWLDPQRRILALDAIDLVIFASLVATCRRWWVIGVTALQLLATVLHFTILTRPTVHAFAYLTALAGLNYALLAVLAFGTWQVSKARHPPS